MKIQLLHKSDAFNFDKGYRLVERRSFRRYLADLRKRPLIVVGVDHERGEITVRSTTNREWAWQILSAPFRWLVRSVRG